MRLAFIHRGSATAKMIMSETGIPRWGRGCRADVLVNYGVAGSRFIDWQTRNTFGRRLPMLNKPIRMNKFEVLREVEPTEIKVPETRRYLDRRHALDGWLEKPFYSQAGRGICVATTRRELDDKYYQQFISNRLYELRVHAFNWISTDEWVIQKRVSEDPEAITWNHHTGGSFITVNDRRQRVFEEAEDIAQGVLKALGMQFGGVDLIVDTNRKVYFIEINSAVGCHGLSDPIYVDAFERLKGMDIGEVLG